MQIMVYFMVFQKWLLQEIDFKLQIYALYASHLRKSFKRLPLELQWYILWYISKTACILLILKVDWMHFQKLKRLFHSQPYRSFSTFLDAFYGNISIKLCNLQNYLVDFSSQ